MKYFLTGATGFIGTQIARQLAHAGHQVHVLTPDNHVTVRSVQLGQRIGNRWIVEKGLKAGERVVLDAPSLKDGVVVNPQPAAAGPEAH